MKKASVFLAALFILLSCAISEAASEQELVEEWWWDESNEEGNINFRGLINESLIFLALQHSYRISTEEKTRKELGGSFFKDWSRSLKINGWDDGGSFFTNFVAHPMMGSTSVFIFANNDEVSQEAEFWSGNYVRAKKRQLIFALIYSTQFEFGLISESSIGNIGKYGKHGWVDLVITPTAGIAWSVAEDAADRFILDRIRNEKPKLANTLSILMTPTKSLANIFAFRAPWYRSEW